MAGQQAYWQAVADAIETRLKERGMTQQDLAMNAGVALTTVRELRRNRLPRARSPRTLAAISDALGYPSGHLEAIALHGPEARPQPTVEDRIDAIERRLAAVESRLDGSS